MDESVATKISRKRPYVKVSYWIQGNDEPDNLLTFDASNVGEARIGLQVGRTPEKMSPGEVSYSGMHDQGVLIPPREGGNGALLVGAINMAKKSNDDYLTKIIEERKIAAQDQQETQPTKKVKMNENGGGI